MTRTNIKRKNIENISLNIIEVILEKTITLENHQLKNLTKIEIDMLENIGQKEIIKIN